MSESRRSFFRNATMLGAGLMTWAESLRAQTGSKAHDHPSKGTASVKKKPAGPPASMESPDIGDMPFTMDGGTKVFHLIAEQVKRRIVPWKTLDVWGYNGSCPGPTIQVQQGDRVRIRCDPGIRAEREVGPRQGARSGAADAGEGKGYIWCGATVETG